MGLRVNEIYAKLDSTVMSEKELVSIWDRSLNIETDNDLKLVNSLLTLRKSWLCHISWIKILLDTLDATLALSTASKNCILRYYDIKQLDNVRQWENIKLQWVEKMNQLFVEKTNDWSLDNFLFPNKNEFKLRPYQADILKNSLVQDLHQAKNENKWKFWNMDKGFTWWWKTAIMQAKARLAYEAWMLPIIITVSNSIIDWSKWMEHDCKWSFDNIWISNKWNIQFWDITITTDVTFKNPDFLKAFIWYWTKVWRYPFFIFDEVDRMPTDLLRFALINLKRIYWSLYTYWVSATEVSSFRNINDYFIKSSDTSHMDLIRHWHKDWEKYIKHFLWFNVIWRWSANKESITNWEDWKIIDPSKLNNDEKDYYYLDQIDIYIEHCVKNWIWEKAIFFFNSIDETNKFIEKFNIRIAEKSLDISAESISSKSKDPIKQLEKFEQWAIRVISVCDIVNRWSNLWWDVQHVFLNPRESITRTVHDVWRASRPFKDFVGIVWNMNPNQIQWNFKPLLSWDIFPEWMIWDFWANTEFKSLDEVINFINIKISQNPKKIWWATWIPLWKIWNNTPWLWNITFASEKSLKTQLQIDTEKNSNIEIFTRNNFLSMFKLFMTLKDASIYNPYIRIIKFPDNKIDFEWNKIIWIPFLRTVLSIWCNCNNMTFTDVKHIDLIWYRYAKIWYNTRQETPPWKDVMDRLQKEWKNYLWHAVKEEIHQINWIIWKKCNLDDLEKNIKWGNNILYEKIRFEYRQEPLELSFYQVLSILLWFSTWKQLEKWEFPKYVQAWLILFNDWSKYSFLENPDKRYVTDITTIYKSEKIPYDKFILDNFCEIFEQFLTKHDLCISQLSWSNKILSKKIEYNWFILTLWTLLTNCLSLASWWRIKNEDFSSYVQAWIEISINWFCNDEMPDLDTTNKIIDKYIKIKEDKDNKEKLLNNLIDNNFYIIFEELWIESWVYFTKFWPKRTKNILVNTKDIPKLEHLWDNEIFLNEFLQILLVQLSWMWKDSALRNLPIAWIVAWKYWIEEKKPSKKWILNRIETKKDFLAINIISDHLYELIEWFIIKSWVNIENFSTSIFHNNRKKWYMIINHKWESYETSFEAFLTNYLAWKLWINASEARKKKADSIPLLKKDYEKLKFKMELAKSYIKLIQHRPDYTSDANTTYDIKKYKHQLLKEFWLPTKENADLNKRRFLLKKLWNLEWNDKEKFWEENFNLFVYLVWNFNPFWWDKWDKRIKEHKPSLGLSAINTIDNLNWGILWAHFQNYHDLQYPQFINFWWFWDIINIRNEIFWNQVGKTDSNWENDNENNNNQYFQATAKYISTFKKENNLSNDSNFTYFLRELKRLARLNDDSLNEYKIWLFYDKSSNTIVITFSWDKTFLENWIIIDALEALKHDTLNKWTKIKIKLHDASKGSITECGASWLDIIKETDPEKIHKPVKWDNWNKNKTKYILTPDVNNLWFSKKLKNPKPIHKIINKKKKSDLIIPEMLCINTIWYLINCIQFTIKENLWDKYSTLDTSNQTNTLLQYNINRWIDYIIKNWDKTWDTIQFLNSEKIKKIVKLFSINSIIEEVINPFLKINDYHDIKLDFSLIDDKYKLK